MAGRFGALLRERLAGLVDLSEDQVARLEAHFELMVRWNRTINLTTVCEVEEAVERHYCESLFLGRLVGLAGSGNRVVDIGSGAGFPGFPVAVLLPECEVTLVEAHQRKAVFLKEASRGVRNIRVLARRVEEVGELFDWAVSRAVSYRDLDKHLKQLGKRAALLTGVEEPPEELGFEWEAAVGLPWAQQRGEQRFVRISRFT